MVDLIGQFLSNLGLLLIGWIVTSYTVNKYQKTKDFKKIREDLIKIHAESFSKLMAFRRTWNKHITVIAGLINKRNETKELELPGSEEVYFSFHEFDVKRRLLFGKIMIHLQLNEEQGKAYVENDLLFSKMGNTIEPILEDPLEYYQKYAESTLKEDALRFFSIHSALIDIILSAEIKE